MSFTFRSSTRILPHDTTDVLNSAMNTLLFFREDEASGEECSEDFGKAEVCPQKTPRRGWRCCKKALKKGGKPNHTNEERCISIDWIAQYLALSRNGGTLENLFHSFPYGVPKDKNERISQTHQSENLVSVDYKVNGVNGGAEGIRFCRVQKTSTGVYSNKGNTAKNACTEEAKVHMCVLNIVCESVSQVETVSADVV